MEPRYPAPPVTSTFILIALSPLGLARRTIQDLPQMTDRILGGVRIVTHEETVVVGDFSVLDLAHTIVLGVLDDVMAQEVAARNNAELDSVLFHGLHDFSPV